MARMDTGPVAPFASRNRPSVQSAPGQVPPFLERPVPAPPAPVLSDLHAEPPLPPPPVSPLGRPLNEWPGAGEGLNLTRGRSGHKQLLLSFDGGSNAEVATEVLDLLKARGVRTTIFLTGSFIQHFPALVRRMAAEGHELGNHTMNHPHFAPGMKRDPRWTRERIQRELLEADAALVKLLGRPMDPVWRAPYGEQTAEIRRWAEELGYRHVGWSEGADTLDWATPKERRLYRSGDAIVKRLEQRLNRDGDGLIVLMHLGSERAVGDRPTKGLGAFIDRALSAGWTFVPVSAFIRDLGKPAWDGRRRMALLTAQPKDLIEKNHPAKAQAGAALHP
jgi:peptidoglycan/xylan/chitin deacetylase (PgdA/CDA1 family)